MTVFISYSRKDEALVHFLAYVLENGGIKCRVDRNLPTGQQFDAELRTMIKEVDLVLVLLSERSLRSQWVNQEIGFATALGKVVYPLVVERNVAPDGLLKMCQMYSLLDWSKPKETIQRLIADLRAAGRPSSTGNNHIPLDKALDSKDTRTAFLVAKLKELAADPGRELDICQQAAFSIFATSKDIKYAKTGGHSPQYMKLLLQERRLTDKLVRAPGNRYRLILWPVRTYDQKYRTLRFTNLLKWLREVESHPTIEVRCGEFLEPSNRLLVADEFVLDGYKPQQAAGFDFSWARFDPAKLEQAQDEFDEIWNRLDHDKAEAIQLIEAKYAELGKRGRLY